MSGEILEILSHYKYIGIYLLLALGIIGLPIPDETIMVIVGTQTLMGGMFSYPISIVVSFCGSMTGMMISYYVGKRLGRPFLMKYGKWLRLRPARIRLTERWFRRYGLWSVTLGYFIPGIRHFTCYFAGMSRVGLLRYVMYAGSGALIWCVTFISLGHFLGSQWKYVMRTVHHYVGLLIIIIGIIIVIALVYMVLKNKNKKKRRKHVT